MSAENAAKFASPSLRLSTVKVFVRSVGCNFTSPWQMRPQRSSTGSGLCVDRDRHRILTNFHVVADAVAVRVRRYGDPSLYVAKVLCVSPQCDLALLQVDEPAFWREVQAIELSEEVPALDSDVITIGYPMGGDNISVTRGVVSRIDLMDYTFSPVGGERLPVIQVDAAINPGNSGGPVLGAGGKAVGVAFAGLKGGGEGIGYVIPGVVARFFLQSYEQQGSFPGLCGLGIRVQPSQSLALREFHGLPAGTGANGVLILQVAPLSAMAKAGVRAGDALLEVDGVPVAEDSTVPFRKEGSGERIGFDFLVTRKVAGEATRLKVSSGPASTPREVTIEVSPIQRLVPKTQYVDAEPSYLVVGGLVFMRLTVPWLEARFSKSLRDAPAQLLQKLSDFKKDAEEEVVIMSKVLAAEVNYGYEDLSCLQLLEFSTDSIDDISSGKKSKGTEVRSLKHLRELLVAARSQHGVARRYLCFKFTSEIEIVLDAYDCDAAESSILQQNGIPRECSEDLLQKHRTSKL